MGQLIVDAKSKIAAIAAQRIGLKSVLLTNNGSNLRGVSPYRHILDVDTLYIHR
jgi:hypothetical protein